jgi:sigma-B regulation protein RsbU (phosphoserine phosphatase)
MNEDKDRILLVEDDEDTTFILNRLLTKNNYEVRTASNGVEALDIIDDLHPKVILADWTMPEMDGLQLCDHLKKQEQYKAIYFIVLTARASLRDRVKGLDVGADDFLVKPVENQELLARIRSGIRINNLQNELKSIEHNKAVLEMATTIGHRINNPLSSLMMALSNLKEEIPDSELENIKEDFYVIDQSIDRIKKFVEALKKLDKPEFTEYVANNKMLKIDDND